MLLQKREREKKQHWKPFRSKTARQKLQTSDMTMKPAESTTPHWLPRATIDGGFNMIMELKCLYDYSNPTFHDYHHTYMKWIVAVLGDSVSNSTNCKQHHRS